jgi:hypothetical protein
MDLNDLYPASFRGIPFLLRDSTTQGGAKTVIHEYPNDSRRYVEGLGRYKRAFTITAFVTGDFYFINRNALQKALDDSSIGILTHPFCGIVKAVAISYTVRESTTELGVASFDINFSEADPAINPVDSGSVISKIIDAADQIDFSLQDAFIGGFNVSTFFPDNFTKAATKLGTLNAAFETFKGFLGKDTDTSDLVNEQGLFAKNVDKNIKAPASLASSISDLFAIANNTSDNALLTGQGYQSLFNFGKSDAFIPEKPQEALEFRNNNTVTNYVVAVYALIYSYLNFSQVTFEDDVQLNDTASQLEKQYQRIVNGSLIDAQQVEATSVLGNDVLDQLEGIRRLARRQFDDDALNVAKIVEITVPEPSSVTLISYRYFGTTDEAASIIALNDIQDVSFASGTLRVRTAPAINA